LVVSHKKGLFIDITSGKINMFRNTLSLPQKGEKWMQNIQHIRNKAEKLAETYNSALILSYEPSKLVRSRSERVKRRQRKENLILFHIAFLRQMR